MTPEQVEYFKKVGKKGGKYGAAGGHRAALNMTPEQRAERARKAVEARWAKARRRKKKS